MNHYLIKTVIIVSFLALLPACGWSTQPDRAESQLAQTPADNETIETITIDSVHYPVPAPWKGNRVDAPKLAYEDFRQIPPRFCKDGGKIYVTTETRKHLVEMLEQAEEDGFLIQAESGYRSAHYQKKIYKKMLQEGRDFDDIVRYVAPPGYSNHMLGTAVDFSPSNWRFADTEQYLWLQEHGASFGFEETYSETNEMKMPWESWHWQYVGLPELFEPPITQ